MNRISKNMEIVLDQGKELIEFYRANPCIAAYDLLGVDLAPIQRVVFEDMWFKDYVIAVAGRGFGKTFLQGTLAALSALLYPGYRVGLIGPVFRQCFCNDINNLHTFWTSEGLITNTSNFYDSIAINTTSIQSLSNSNIILNKWRNEERDCIGIKTKKGYEVCGTTDHKVLTLDKYNKLVYRELSSIEYYNYILIRKGFNYFGNDNSMPKFDEFEHDWRTKDCLIPEELTPDLSYWMGLLVGDGCVSVSKNKRKQRISFVNEDQDLLDSFESYLIKYFITNKDEKIDRRNRKNNTWEIQYFCKKLVRYLLKCGFTKTTALDKKIPEVLKKASRENLIAFIQGLYDTDGGVYVQKRNNGCTVSFNTSSLQLAKEVQSVLLNLGIISNLAISNKVCVKQLSQGNKPSKCAAGYKIRITGIPNLIQFNDVIGFRCIKKDKKLNTYLLGVNNITDYLPIEIGLPLSKINGDRELFESYRDSGFYFVKPKDINKFRSESIDIEVENEHCYWANGFINHNSKMIFSEVEKLYGKSPILKEATIKQPTRGADTCFLKFKSVGGANGSFIEALPLGNDGSKIRGSRFYLICVDELAQVPDEILDLVLRPMAATALEPMERVRRIEHQKMLIEQGLATEDDFDDERVNKMVMTSSGYYKFNHMWRRMQDYWLQMDLHGEKSRYAVHQVPYWLLPDGFLDKNNIEEAKRVMSSAEYRMEYEAEMISDSEGFFLASLLESCTLGSGFPIEIVGDSSSEYVLGIDPNQGGSASCGVVIVKLGNPNKVVNVQELKKLTTQELTLTVQNICSEFNINRIYMDKGGGGKSICDLLEEGYGGFEPIIDITNKDHIHLPGRHILEMVDFSTQWISDANFGTLSLLEDKRLRFPETPVNGSDMQARIYENTVTLKSQMANIVVTQTASGRLHFDTPTKGQNKDLYSAMILAGYGARLLEIELEDSGDPILYNSNGMIRRHEPGGGWRQLVGNPTVSSRLASAVLTKPIK